MLPIRPASQGGPSIRRDRQAVREAPASRVVPKPVPERQKVDARTYQIEQLRRRYKPKESVAENGDTSFLLNLAPSDPDFPFDLDHLKCDLRVPAGYPKQPPRLAVKNTDIPRGFAINIERGWDMLVQEKRGATLLALTNALDKRLESLLSEQKAETFKLTTFKDTRHIQEGSSPVAQPVKKPAFSAPKPPSRRLYVPEESFTKEQIAQAKARRALEVQQLEARMGKMPFYHKSSDGIVYTLQLEPKRKLDLPPGLRAVQSAQLIIPLLYPLQPLRILLNDVESKDAEPVEELFAQKALEHKQMTLMAHLNYFVQSIASLANQAQAPPSKKPGLTLPAAPASNEVVKQAGQPSVTDDDKSHIHVIPRPPEWVLAGSSDSESSDSDFDEDDEDDDGGVAIEPSKDAEGSSVLPTQTAERGIAMFFPSVELHGIELLQVPNLSLSVKCERCKTLNEVTGLMNNLEKSGSCKKCATNYTVRFRQELIHQNSTRAGFIDVTACTVADMLPSTFIPTCSTCSTPAPGIVSVRGETTTNVCRECHGRFTFAVPEVKFLAYSSNNTRLPPTTGPKRKQEKLGLHAGEPLPDRGACTHYRRSYRWFRFSCCNKVYPCDRCHDAAAGHENEWANRMICGWCSREQNYSVESCAFCGRSVIGKRGKGYWEGGKGTRNQVLMRRGDKRKYRRIGGGEAKKKGT